MTSLIPACEDITQLIVSLFNRWEATNIRFLVLRGYETLPSYTSHDIDLGIHKDDLDRAERILFKIARQTGYIVHNVAKLSPQHLVMLYNPKTGYQVHFDIVSNLTWRGLTLVVFDDLYRDTRQFSTFSAPSLAGESVFNLLNRLILSGKVKPQHKESINEAFRDFPERCHNFLLRVMTPKTASRLTEKVALGQWISIEQDVALYRHSLIWHQTRRYLPRLLSSLVNEARITFKRLTSPAGLFLVIMGVDGSGKSSVAAALPNALMNTFSPDRGQHVHWKPIEWRRKRGSGVFVDDPHASPPRSQVMSFFYLLGHSIDFFIGSWLIFTLKLFRNGMVIAERYYYDVYIDPKRYRVKLPTWLLAFVGIWFRQPDLILCFDLPPEEAVLRKPELPIQEVERQRNAYLAFAHQHPNCIIINSLHDLNLVIQNSTLVILDSMRHRAESRFPVLKEPC